MRKGSEKLIARIFEIAPELAAGSIRKDDDALANDVFIVDEAYVFRFPKTRDAREVLKRELRILEVTARHVDIAIPKIEKYGEDFGMYAYIQGQPLYWHDWLRMTTLKRQLVASELANFLKQLHHISKDQIAELDLPESTPKRHEYYVWFYGEVVNELYPYLWKDQKSFYDHLFRPLLAGGLDLDEYDPVFRHNDLASYHILYNPVDGSLRGILDFGTAGMGDAADDLATLINAYGEKFIKAMIPGYPELQELLPRARFKAFALELEWALQGIRNSAPEWFLVHLGRARDVEKVV